MDGSDDAPRIVVELGPERVSLSAGGGCWIADDGSAECWDGDDEWSQDGNFVQISAGPLFACGVTSEGSVRCWSKEHGEGFYQSWWDTKQEIPVSEGTPVKQVVVDGPHLCAIHTDGTLGCYGREYHGIRLPVEGWEDPEPGPLPEGTFTQMSTGAWRYGDSSTGLSCAIRADTGRLACWDYGGKKPAPQGQFSQVSVSLGLLSGVIYIGGIAVPHSAGILVCGVLTDGRIECWSDAGGGEGTRSAMTEFYAPDGEFAQVSAGTHDICGLRTDGTIMCWGIEYREEIGGIRVGGDQQATVELARDTRLAQISVGGGRVCGIGTDGDLKCWTIPRLADAQAQQDSGDTDAVKQEGSAVVETDAHGVIRISGIGTGEYQIVLDEGTWVPMFSADGEFRLSISRPDQTLACHEVISGFALVSLSGAGAVAKRGRAAVIGTDRNSMCEAGGFTVDVWTDSDTTRWGLDYRMEPVPGWGTGGAAVLNRSATDFVHIDAGTNEGGWWLSDAFPYVCGVRSGGGAECWGPGFRHRGEPPMDTFTGIATHDNLTCGLTPDGSVECWDETNTWYMPDTSDMGIVERISVGQFAVCGIRTDKSLVCRTAEPELSSPTPPPGSYHYVAAYSMDQACAITSDGSVICTDEYATAPPPGRFDQISIGAYHSCGVLIDGTVQCWGEARDPEAGVAPAGEFTEVAVGRYHTCALRPDGTAECWGWNGFGQSAPPSGPFVQLASTAYASCGLRPDGSVECWGLSPDADE